MKTGAEFFCFKDAQANIIDVKSNIVALLDSNGSVVVKYKYDAWGKCTVDASTTNTTLANLNPFRYRGYYYDEEIEMYYLQSRYYNPIIARFVSEDDIVVILSNQSILSYNIFNYCDNCSVIQTIYIIKNYRENVDEKIFFEFGGDNFAFFV